MPRFHPALLRNVLPLAPCALWAFWHFLGKWHPARDPYRGASNRLLRMRKLYAAPKGFLRIKVMERPVRLWR